MNDFNDNNNNTNNTNNQNNNDFNGTLNGFDEAKKTDNLENNQGNQEKGYTITPEGGYYTKQKNDIIQDDVTKDNKENNSTNEYNNYSTQSNPYVKQQGYNTNGGYQSYSYNQSNNVNNQPYYSQYQKPPKQNKPKKSKRYGAGIIIAASFLAAVIGAGSAVFAVSVSKNNSSPTVIPKTSNSSSNVNINIDETAESVVEAVATKVTPSVVGIRTTTSVASFFGGNQESTGEGSGVVYSEDGYIITNYHVISDAVSNKTGSKIEVFIDSSNSDAYEATVVGYNISSDLAIIKINVKGLTPIEFTDSSSLKVGQYVITVGNPGGLEFMDSVTYGVISGLNRVISSNSSVSLIQTDAAINPGNSGGALVNTKGQLVGINSSKIVSEEFEGMGFAIPSNNVLEISKNIISKQNDPEPYIGVSVSERYTAEVLKYYGYPAGAVILSVAEGSPAETAGLSKGDIITEFNGKTVEDYSKLEGLLNDCSPKQNVSVKIYRSGRYYTTSITVGSNNAVN